MTRRADLALDRRGYSLEVQDAFEASALDSNLWIPTYLPHWTTAARAAARYEVGHGRLTLRIDADQPAWNPELTGEMRVSSLQSGTFAGPEGSPIGQHRFRDTLRVHEPGPPDARYTARHGLFELRARFSDDPATMAAFWLIGYEDQPDRSGEICIAEVFGRDVHPDRVDIGMGIHPHHDPTLHEEFGRETVRIDAREAHSYAAEWTTEYVAFYVDERLVKARAPIAGVPDADHARHLRVSGARGAVPAGPVSEGLRGGALPRLSSPLTRLAQTPASETTVSIRRIVFVGCAALRSRHLPSRSCGRRSRRPPHNSSWRSSRRRSAPVAIRGLEEGRP